MSPKELFEFLKENLTLDIGDSYESDYGREGLKTYKSYTIKLLLTNPETNKTETIGTVSLSMDG
jgi:hypothetical protein